MFGRILKPMYDNQTMNFFRKWTRQWNGQLPATTSLFPPFKDANSRESFLSSESIDGDCAGGTSAYNSNTFDILGSGHDGAMSLYNRNIQLMQTQGS